MTLGPRPGAGAVGPASRRRLRVLVCRGPECGDKRNSASVYAEFERCLAQLPRSGSGLVQVDVTLGWQSCFGQCRRGVNVLLKELRPGEDPFFGSFLALGGVGSALYNAVVPAEVPRIVDEHIVQGKVVVELKGRGG